MSLDEQVTVEDSTPIVEDVVVQETEDVENVQETQETDGQRDANEEGQGDEDSSSEEEGSEEEVDNDAAVALGLTDEAVKEFLGDDYDDSDLPVSYKALPKSARTELIDLYTKGEFNEELADKYGELWATNVISIAHKDIDDSSKQLLTATLKDLAAEQLKMEYRTYTETKNSVPEAVEKEFEKILTPEYSLKIDSIYNTIDQRYRGDFDDFMVDNYGEILDNLSADNAAQFVEALEKAKEEFNSSSYRYGRLTKEAGKSAAATQAYIDSLNATLSKAGATGRVLNHTEPMYLDTIKAAESILSRAGINLSGTKEHSEFYKMLRTNNAK
jgi:hypothetical protein